MNSGLPSNQRNSVIFAREILTKIKNKTKMGVAKSPTTDDGMPSNQDGNVSNVELDDQLAREQARKF
jgi:hypothetical protein